MAGKARALLDKTLPSPRSSLHIATSFDAVRSDIEEAFAPYLKAKNPCQVRFFDANAESKQAIWRLAKTATPYIRSIGKELGLGKVDAVNPGEVLTLEVLEIARDVKERSAPDSQVVSAKLSMKLGRMVVGRQVLVTRSEYYVLRFYRFIAPYVDGFEKLTQPAVDKIYFRLKLGNDQPYIRAHEGIELDQAQLEDIFSKFRESGRTFQIDVMLFNAFDGMTSEDIRNHLEWQAAKVIGPKTPGFIENKRQADMLLQSMGKTIKIKFRQILQHGQTPIKIRQDMYVEKLTGSVAQRGDFGSIIIVGDNESVVSLAVFRRKAVYRSVAKVCSIIVFGYLAFKFVVSGL